MIEESKKFVRESAEELKKVVWPTKDEAVQAAVVVVVFIVVFSLFLALLDFGLSSLVKLVLNS